MIFAYKGAKKIHFSKMPKTPSTRKLRNVCFTINNYTEEEYAHVTNWLKANSKYAIVAKETGENKATPHLQGYAEFTNPRRFSALRSALPRAHLEPRRGTSKQAADYCRKEDANPFEHGQAPKGPGFRSDLAQLAANARDLSKTTYEVMDAQPATYMRYHKHVAHLRSLQKQQDRKFTPMTVEVYWGAPGTGKTRKAHEDDPNLFILPVGGSGNTVWWDGYDPVEHNTVLIDDFYGGCIKYPYLLKILDGYRFNLSVKGGFVWKSYTRVIITSNKSIDEWYPAEVDISALKRRITKCTHFAEPL